MEDKSWYSSKTILGAAFATLIAIAQVMGVPYSDLQVAKIVQIIGVLISVWGLRSAIGRVV